MRHVAVMCLAGLLAVPAAADEPTPEPGTRQWRALERAVGRYCRAHPGNEDCDHLVAALRSWPQRVQLAWHDGILEMLDGRHPCCDDSAPLARLRRQNRHWVVVEVTSTDAAL